MIDPMGHVLILSDTHSNYHALKAVWDWVQESKIPIRSFASLGDQVGYGPQPQDTLDLFTQMANTIHGQFLRGNHDSAVWGMEDLSRWNPHAVEQISWTQGAIKDDSVIHGAHPKGDLEGNDNFRIVHDNFSSPGEGEYILGTWDAQGEFHGDDFGVGFFGHTHIQVGYSYNGRMVRKVLAQEDETVLLDPGTRYMFNPGSVGQPRDRDPRAAFMVFNTQGMEVTGHRVPYDIEATIAMYEGTTLNPNLGERLRDGR